MTFLLTSLFRIGPSVLRPLSWMVPFSSLFAIPFLLKSRGGLIYGLSIGISTILLLHKANPVIEKALESGIIDHLLYVLVMLIIIGVHAYLGWNFGKLRTYFLQEKKSQLLRAELEEKRNNFFSITTHEICSPLTLISGYVNILKGDEGKLTIEERKDYFEIIDKNLSRIFSLMEGIRDSRKIEKGAFQIQMVPLNFLKFFNEISQPYRELLGKQFELNCFTNEIVEIRGDRIRLGQVIDNLIHNAIKNTSPEKRMITVIAENDSEVIRIKIIDNGAGILSENLDQLFKIFVSFPTEYASISSGVGLYVSRTIIEQHKGHIMVESDGKGRGSTFIVEIPKIKTEFDIKNKNEVIDRK